MDGDGIFHHVVAAAGIFKRAGSCAHGAVLGRHGSGEFRGGRRRRRACAAAARLGPPAHLPGGQPAPLGLRDLSKGDLFYGGAFERYGFCMGVQWHASLGVINTDTVYNCCNLITPSITVAHLPGGQPGS